MRLPGNWHESSNLSVSASNNLSDMVLRGFSFSGFSVYDNGTILMINMNTSSAPIVIKWF